MEICCANLASSEPNSGRVGYRRVGFNSNNTWMMHPTEQGNY